MKWHSSLVQLSFALLLCKRCLGLQSRSWFALTPSHVHCKNVIEGKWPEHNTIQGHNSLTIIINRTWLLDHTNRWCICQAIQRAARTVLHPNEHWWCAEFLLLLSWHERTCRPFPRQRVLRRSCAWPVVVQTWNEGKMDRKESRKIVTTEENRSLNLIPKFRDQQLWMPEIQSLNSGSLKEHLCGIMGWETWTWSFRLNREFQKEKSVPSVRNVGHQANKSGPGCDKPKQI